MQLVAPPAGFVAPERVTAPARLSQRVPAVYPLAVWAHRARRRLEWMRSDAVWASARSSSPLAHRVKAHSSLLMRELSEDEMHLQRNKVVNLRLAAARVDGILVGPGETLSFNRVVGSCTRRRGYLDGMRLSNGEARAGVGGGICQLANLLHWMVLHSPLTVVERSEHSFDPFPDKARVLPWGVGCSIVYNYVDLVVRNDTDITFQVSCSVGERHLDGELRSDRPTPHSYRVQARHEAFIKAGDDLFRRNEIWRTVIDKRTGDVVGEELVKHNCALVRYEPLDDVPVIDASLADASARH
ncbi:VanW family protein [Humibacillus xanthopallidus]|nr:VanW family protein [Humibacillus xanthopallidus]